MIDNNGIRVLSVIPGTAHGPVMIFSKRQIKALVDAGIQQRIVYLESRFSLFGLINDFKLARKYIREFNPQLVHSHYGTITALFCMFLRKPMVITFQGSDINYTPSDGLFRDFFGRLLSNIDALFAKKIICVSENVRNMVWWAKSKCIVIPIGIDIDQFQPKNMLDCRKLLNWENTEFVVLFNANNPSIKRLDIAKAVIQRAGEYGFDKVRLEAMMGNVDPELVPVMINACNCVLLCSDNEGSPTIIKEAMACNKPIISTAVGDVVERIKDVTNCYIVSQDIETIASKICELAGSNEVYETNGREILRRDGLTDKQTADRVIEVYRLIV